MPTGLETLTTKEWLGLTVVAAVITTAGSLLGVLLKDFLFSRSLERWKQRLTLEQVYQRYRDPLFLAAHELATRLAEIDKHYPTVYLRREVLDSCPARQLHNSIDDPYYQKYKLLSTTYRLMALLGWLELYRQDVTYLNSGSNAHSRNLEKAVDLIRCDLADGQLNQARDWPRWRDTLIFREELRAIGEAMLESRGTVRSVMGYGKFCQLLEDEDKGKDGKALARWFPVVTNFLLDLEMGDKDFRRVRVKRLLAHVADLMQLLRPQGVEQWLRDTRDEVAAQVNMQRSAA
jgi:hypothetical protein